ncbi:MAG: hypothetical protein IJ564_00755 [Alphaproteobacteria bacterium]|nr:hypothetical protein [Alphaproteobacteria bacterium]
MPKLKTKKKSADEIRKINVKALLNDTFSYIRENPQFVLCLIVVNMVFMLFFKAIGGISNPLSILWCAAYYLFWCWFYRYYYHLKPYIFSKTVFGSLAPSTKALVLMGLVFAVILVTPMVPLFVGFNDVYLNYYENYISAVESLSTQNDIEASFADIAIIYGIFALLSPMLICKPYMAWISSLRGHNASFRKAGDKTKGNYLSFAIISALLLYPEAVCDKLDAILGADKWLSYVCSTLIFAYTNIIFAKMYDFFYLKH